MPVCVPGVSVGRIGKSITIRIVSRSEASDGGHSIRGGIIRGLKRVASAANRYGLGDVAERIVTEVLLPDGGSAIDAGNARKVIVGIGTCLAIRGIEGISDGELFYRAIGVPSKRSDVRLTVYIELVFCCAARVRVERKHIGVAGTECGDKLRRRSKGIVVDRGNGVLS